MAAWRRAAETAPAEALASAPAAPGPAPTPDGAVFAMERPAEPSPRRRAKVRRLRERFVFQREMRLRLISALVLAPVAIAATAWSEVSFALIVLFGAGFVITEWLRMIGAGAARLVSGAALAGLGAITLVAATQSIGFALGALVAAAGLTALVAMPRLTGAAARARPVCAPATLVAAGVLYCGVAVIALVALRKGEAGTAAVLFVLFTAWASDTFAYLVGRQVGGPKLWRRVSPSKTWSGAAGGLVGGIAVGLLTAYVADLTVTLTTALVAAGLAAAAQAGDLGESALKRRFALKDAGTLIPGHGGVMDRVDGLIGAAVLAGALGATVAPDAAGMGFLRLLGG